MLAKIKVNDQCTEAWLKFWRSRLASCLDYLKMNCSTKKTPSLLLLMMVVGSCSWAQVTRIWFHVVLPRLPFSLTVQCVGHWIARMYRLCMRIKRRCPRMCTKNWLCSTFFLLFFVYFVSLFCSNYSQHNILCVGGCSKNKLVCRFPVTKVSTFFVCYFGTLML